MVQNVIRHEFCKYIICLVGFIGWGEGEFTCREMVVTICVEGCLVGLVLTSPLKRADLCMKLYSVGLGFM